MTNRQLMVVAIALLATAACGDSASVGEGGGGTDPTSSSVGGEGGITGVGGADPQGGGGANPQGGGGGECMPETESAFCAAESAACGSVTGTNQCGDTWTVDCGSCTAPQTCGTNAMANQCVVEGWAVETVDATGDVGHEISLALDLQNHPHIAYRNDSGPELRVAAFDGTSWTVDTLDSSTLAASTLAIAFDPAGTAHVAAFAFDGLSLWTRSGATWNKDTISTLVHGRLDLTHDTNGDPHVCAHLSSVDALHYWTRSGTGPWQNETVDGGSPAASQGNYCSIAVGTDGSVHISYQDSQFQRLKYAVKPLNGTWAPEVVDAPSGDSAGTYTAIHLDASNNPLIAYRAGLIAFNEIRLATRNGASWDIETVNDDAGTIANFTSLDLAADGTPFVSYYTTEGAFIRVGSRPATTWTISSIEAVGTGSGGFNDLALGTDGALHLAFYNAITKDLRYARQDP